MSVRASAGIFTDCGATACLPLLRVTPAPIEEHALQFALKYVV